MGKSYEGLPAAANMEQSILLAQLQILRTLERETAGIVRSVRPSADDSTAESRSHF